MLLSPSLVKKWFRSKGLASFLTLLAVVVVSLAETQRLVGTKAEADPVPRCSLAESPRLLAIYRTSRGRMGAMAPKGDRWMATGAVPRMFVSFSLSRI